MDSILFNLRSLDESSQRELDAYRSIGSVEHLKHLKWQETRRLKRLSLIKPALKNVLFWACVAFCIWAFLSWIDVNLHSAYPNPVYQSWNLFGLVL